MKKQEAILISAYTGCLLTKEWNDIHKFIEETLGRPIFIHELSDPKIIEEIHKKLHPQIIELIKNEVTENE